MRLNLLRLHCKKISNKKPNVEHNHNLFWKDKKIVFFNYLKDVICFIVFRWTINWQTSQTIKRRHYLK